MNVTIGIPSQGRWVDAMGLSLIHALYALPHGTNFSMPRGPYLDIAREKCLVDALAAKSDYLVFVDTDMRFPANAITQLIDAGKDIIGVMYNEKRLPPVSTVKLDDSADGLMVAKEIPDVPFQCASVGTGLMAINLARLIQCMAPPCFSYSSLNGQFMGEDIAMCRRARASGLEVWCDPTIPVQHIGDFAF